VFWSPDSRFIGYFTPDKLMKVARSGGLPQTIAAAPLASGGTWNRDDVILFSSAAGIQRVPASGGAAVPLAALGKTARQPYFLPDGRHFLFVVLADSSTGRSAIHVGALDSDTSQPLVDGVLGDVVYAEPGHLLYVRDGTLFAHPFDADRLGVTGDPVPIAGGFGLGLGLLSGISASPAGIVSYRPGTPETSRLTWFDRRGVQLSELPIDGYIQAPHLSRDGRRVALERTDATGKSDVWILDVQRGTNMRLTLDGESSRPVFSPDGSQIVFGRGDGIFQKASSGTGAEVRLETGEPTDWSADGRHILFIRGGDLWALPMQGDRKPIAVAAGKGNDRRGRFSPDGRWIAYESNESGRFEVYVQAFPAGVERWQVSANGGDSAWWRADGRELFFNAPDEQLMAVTVAPGATFEASPPRALFAIPGAIANGRFIASLDAERFLLPVTTHHASQSPVTVVVNWAPSVTGN
jgi:hypothetical protein